MFLSISAAVLSGLAYVIYLHQVYAGGSIPNPASWTVWAFTATLSAITFWRGSKDWLAATQFFTGSVACIVVWVFTLSFGKFSGLDVMSWVTIVVSFGACLVWYVTENAIYANLIIGGVEIASIIPTITGVVHNSHVEQALPWWLWAIAFAISSFNILRRIDRSKRNWRLLMVMPIGAAIVHGAVAFFARG
jgi:hypothetical protein